MPRLCIHQLVLERLPVWIRARILDDNLFVVIGQLVDDVFDGFAQLELVELGDALGRDGDSNASCGVSGTSWTGPIAEILGFIVQGTRRRGAEMRKTYPDLLYGTGLAFVSPTEEEKEGKLTMIAQIRGDGENERRQDG